MRRNIVRVLFITLVIGYIDASSQCYADNIVIAADLVAFDENQLLISVNIRNDGSNPIFLATDPKDLSGIEGFYVAIDSNSSELNLSSKVHPPANPSPYGDNSNVKLIKLSVGESYSKEIKLKLPLKETKPPKGSLELIKIDGKLTVSDKSYNPKDVDLKKISKLNIIFGYFIDEKEVEMFLGRKPQGWFIKGNDNVYFPQTKPSRRFVDIQHLLSTKLDITIKK